MQKSSLMYSKQTYSGQQPSGKRRASGTIAILIGLMLVILILGGLCSFSWFLRLNHKDQPAPGLLSGLRPEAIFMLSSDEGWIVGTGFTPQAFDFRKSHTENLHYSHGRWVQVESPQVHFSCLSMLSSDDVWAGTPDGFYHWNGKQWTKDAPGAFKNSNQSIIALSMLSHDEGWALSWNHTDNLLHYIGGRWQVGGSLITGPYLSALRSISMVSSNDGWAVGYHFMAHYDGTMWSLVDTPVTQHTDAADIDLISVKMLSHDEGWAVGNIGQRIGQSPSILPQKGVILHYSKGVWSIIQTVPLILTDLSMVSAHEGWAVGAMRQSDTNFLHYSNGRWIAVAQPPHSPKQGSGRQNVASIAMISAREGWGISKDGIYHYQNGSWSTWYVRGPDETF